MSAYRLINQLIHKSRHLFMGNLDHLGLYRGQPKFLIELSKNNGMTKKELSKVLDISAPTVTKTVERLCKKEYLTTQKDEQDRRVTRVYITEEGEALIKYLVKFKEDYNKILFKGIEESEIEALSVTLEKIITNLDEYKEALHEKNV